MEQFHFIRPWWLLALLPALILGVLLWYQNRHQSGWQRFIPKHLAQVLVDAGRQKGSSLLYALLVGWLLAIVAIAGPTWQKLPQPVYQLRSGQVIVMDMSPSVTADDITPNRLTRMRFKAMDLVRSGLDGGTGLIAYSGDAFTISPLTDDSNNLMNLIPSLSPKIMPIQGSDPLSALKLADELLHNAGYSKGDIYWITDGIDSRDTLPLTDFIRNHPHRVSILAVGTENGAPIREADGSLIKDSRGQVVIAQTHFERLANLAHISGGVFVRSSIGNDDIQQLTQLPPLTREGQNSSTKYQGDQWQDNGIYLLLLLLPLALLPWRRGGWLGSVIALFLFSSFTAPSANAQQWWLNKQQQAQQAFDQGRYGEAAELFEDPMRKGAALYKAEQYQQALLQFQQRHSAAAEYNSGNSLYQLQQFAAAVEAYQAALKLRPNWPEAEDNLALAKQQLQKQQQQQQGPNKQQQGQQKQQQSQQQKSQDGDNSAAANAQQQQHSSSQAKPSQSQDSQGNSPQAQQRQQQQSQKKQTANDAQQSQQPSGDGEQPSKQPPQSNPNGFPSDISDEKVQQLQQWLKRVPDDPSILLRNKMLLEYQKRRRQRMTQPQGDQQKW